MFWTMVFVVLALVCAFLALRVRSGHGDRVIFWYLAAPREKLRRLNKAALCRFLWKIQAALAAAMAAGILHIWLGSGMIWLSFGLALITWAFGVYCVNFSRKFRN